MAEMTKQDYDSEQTDCLAFLRSIKTPEHKKGVMERIKNSVENPKLQEGTYAQVYATTYGDRAAYTGDVDAYMNHITTRMPKNSGWGFDHSFKEPTTDQIITLAETAKKTMSD